MESLVTIVIPSFDKGKFLEATLRSVAGQTYPSWRALVVDNGSSDDSAAIVSRWRRRDDRITLINAADGPRNGSYCRNVGLAAAGGRYVLFLDADDVLAERCLEDRVAFATRDSERDFWVFATGTFRDAVGDRKGVWQPEGRKPLRALLAHKLSWHTSGTLWTRAYLQRLRGFDAGYSRFQDVETHIRGILHSPQGCAVCRDGVPNAYYRVSDSRFMNPPHVRLMDYVQSNQRLLERIPSELAIAGLQHESAFLSGTALALMLRLDDGLRRKMITAQEAEAAVRTLFASGRNERLWPGSVERVLGWYWSSGRRAARRMRGVNWFCRALLMTLARRDSARRMDG